MEAAAVAEAVDPQEHVLRRRPLLLAGRRGRRTVVVPEVSLHRLRCRAGEHTHNSKGRDSLIELHFHFLFPPFLEGIAKNFL